MQSIVRARAGFVAVFLFVVLVSVSVSVAAQTGTADNRRPDWSKTKAVPVVTDVVGPSNFQFAPDGSIWYTEVYLGNVSRFDPATGKKEFKYHVNSVGVGDERGLVGFALHPKFATNGVFYLYYTEPTENESAGLNKLVRVENGKETLLASLPGAKEHNGGRILIVNESTMFVSTGENQLRSPAQDPKSLLGKILRMTLDGKPIAGNLDGLVYSRGHRNVYGLAFNQETKELWATENSGWRRDEINLIQAKGNYGYPECEGHGLNGVDTPCPTNKGYIFPVMSFYEDRTAAPTGAAVWKGDLYWASLKQSELHRMWKEGDKWKDEVVFKAPETLLDVQVAPDGKSLYIATFAAIYHLEIPGSGGATHSPAPTTASDETTETSTTDGGGIVPGVGLLAVGAALALAFGFTKRRR